MGLRGLDAISAAGPFRWPALAVFGRESAVAHGQILMAGLPGTLLTLGLLNAS
jgi:hypothetical protein